MNSDNGWIFICGIVALVILINVSLIYSFASGGVKQQLNLFSKMAQRARSPWRSEEEALRELHTTVAKLKQPHASGNSGDLPEEEDGPPNSSDN